MHNYLGKYQEKQFLTKFLTLDEQNQLKKKYSKIIFFPENHERKRAILLLDQPLKDYSLFAIALLKISYNEKKLKLKHCDVLGALMNLGLERNCFGDIIIDENIYIVITENIVNYLISNLEKINKINVTVQLTNMEVLMTINNCQYFETTINVCSFRLDAIVAQVIKVSREKAKEYIITKNVKINGSLQLNPDYFVKYDEIISIHRFGRLIVKEVMRKTKKNNLILKILKTI